MRKGQSSDTALGPEWIFLLCFCTAQSYRLPPRTVPWAPAWGCRDLSWVVPSPLIEEMLLVGCGGSLSWLLWVHKGSTPACCALPAPGAVGSRAASWFARVQLGSRVSVPVLWDTCQGWVFGTSHDACWVLQVDSRSSEDPHRCYRNCVPSDTDVLCGLGESQASDPGSSLDSAKDANMSSGDTNSGLHSKHFADRAISQPLILCLH